MLCRIVHGDTGERSSAFPRANNYLALITAHYIHTLDCHPIPLKYIHFYVNKHLFRNMLVSYLDLTVVLFKCFCSVLYIVRLLQKLGLFISLQNSIYKNYITFSMATTNCNKTINYPFCCFPNRVFPSSTCI